MNKKDGFLQRAGNFLTGKGFYIVLALCAVVIGVSAWAMLSVGNADVDTLELEAGMAVTVLPTALPTAPAETPDSEAAMARLDEAETEAEAAGKQSEMESPAPAEEPEAAETYDDMGTDAGETPVISTEDTAIQFGFVWPVDGEIVTPYATSELIYDKTMADWRTHGGIDIGVPIGTKVLAISSGTVENVYEDALYGTTVVIDHGNGLRSVYSNLAAAPTVAVGDQIATGAIIGSVGSTALVETGLVNHLHLETTENGVKVDPMDYLPSR